MLDSDHHASVFGAMSILAQAVAAAAIGLRAVSTRRLALLLVAALVGVLTVPRALMRYVPAFERYDVPILVAPFTVAFVVLCALTFRDAEASAIHSVGIAGFAGVLVRAACGRPASRRRRKQAVRGDAHLGVPSNGHAQARRRAGRVDASRDWNGRGSLAPHGGRPAHRQRHRRAARTQPGDGSQLDRCGVLPGIRIGRRIRIKRADFDRLLDASCAGNKSASARIWSGNVPGPDVPSDYDVLPPVLVNAADGWPVAEGDYTPGSIRAVTVSIYRTVDGSATVITG